MTVYADVIFAVNTVVNYLLLLLGARLTGYPARPHRTILGAVIGGGYAVCVLVPALAFFDAWWGKCMCFVLMVMTAYGLRRKAARPSVASLLCGCALAGFVFLLTQAFSVGVVAFRGHIYYPLAARALVLMAGAFYLAAALLMAGALKHKAKETVSLHIRHNMKQIVISALYDTGNTLVDPVAGKPIIVLEWPRSAELLGVSASREMFLNPSATMEKLAEKYPDCRFRLLPYRAVGTECALLLAVPCEVKIGKRKTTDALVAISPTTVSDGGGYEALIGGNLF